MKQRFFYLRILILGCIVTFSFNGRSFASTQGVVELTVAKMKWEVDRVVNVFTGNANPDDSAEARDVRLELDELKEDVNNMKIRVDRIDPADSQSSCIHFPLELNRDIYNYTLLLCLYKDGNINPNGPAPPISSEELARALVFSLASFGGQLFLLCVFPSYLETDQSDSPSESNAALHMLGNVIMLSYLKVAEIRNIHNLAFPLFFGIRFKIGDTDLKKGDRLTESELINYNQRRGLAGSYAVVVACLQSLNIFLMINIIDQAAIHFSAGPLEMLSGALGVVLLTQIDAAIYKLYTRMHDVNFSIPMAILSDEAKDLHCSRALNDWISLAGILLFASLASYNDFNGPAFVVICPLSFLCTEMFIYGLKRAFRHCCC